MLLSHFHVYHSNVRARSWLLSAPKSLIHFAETMKLVNYSCACSCSSFLHCLPFSPDHHLQLSYSIMFFVGADPPLSLDLSADHKQPLAVVFHPFCHFSFTFIVTVSHIHTGLKFCQTHSQLFPASPGLLLANKWPPMILTGPPFYCCCRTGFNLCILLLGGVEVNPGPSSPVNFTFGMLNTRSAVNKAPLLHSLIADHDLSLLALTETWIKTDDPPVIKNDPAPPGYRIMYVHRENPDQTRGGGLAIVYRDSINVSPRNHNITHTSFEFILVNIGLKSEMSLWQTTPVNVK